MGLRSKGSVEEIRKQLNEAKARVEAATLLRLQKIGEKAVAHAKSVPPEAGFMDRTGNLRSSIGYAIFLNGVLLTQSFTGTQEGVQNGLEHCKAVAFDYSQGWLLVVVAGMEYALAVESRGKDVLTSAEALVWAAMPGELERLKNSIKRMKIK